MPGTNLTREEAATRAALLTVDSYTVDLNLTGSPTHFTSTTVIQFTCAQPGTATFADLVGAEIHQISLNGAELDAAQVYRDSRIALANLADQNELRVHATLPYSRTGEGLHRFVDPADDRVYTYTQFEVPDARRVYTTFEQPDLKSVFSFTITAPQQWKVISNAATPEPVPAADGAATWTFPATERMSTYITALIAGEYHEVMDSYDGMNGTIALGHYCRQSLVKHLDADELLKVTKQGFGFFEKTFGVPYAFGKYDQLYVPEYNMGAMENAGAVTFRDEYLPRSRQTHSFYESRANTILHEMAHMWFGDLVTMKWWDDLWLNESFAEWASHHAMASATEYDDVWTAFTNARKNWAYRQDQLPSTHPIAADNHDLEAVEVNFDGITYAKGASTLKQLVAWVGLEEFLDGLRAYFTEHAFGNTEFTDLLRALEASSGRELVSWADEWLKTSGVNTLTPEVALADDGTYASLIVRQSAADDFPTLRRHRIGIGLYDLADGALTLRERVEVDVRGESTPIDELVGKPQPDLLLLNDGDLTYAKIRLDDRSLATAREHMNAVTDSLTRSLLWGAAWDMTRDAQMPVETFVDLVLSGIGAESDLTAVGRLPVSVRSAIELYTAAPQRDELRRKWESGLRTLLTSAEPGSDHQLAFTRALAAAAHTRESLDLIGRLLTEDSTLPGLDVDTDLRWALLTGLARTGRVGEAEIAAELERDNTISGQERAGMARAVRPDVEAKATAWHDAIERDDVANETQRQIALGFATPGQGTLLGPYLEKYLTVAETIWEDKGVQRASTALTYMFPLPAVSAEAVHRVQHWLETTSANPATKRYVSEGLDDMQRALRAQQRNHR